MSDRDAKLKIGVDASEMGPAAEKVKGLRTEIEKVGDAGSGTAGDLKKTAAAIGEVESAEVGATQASRDAANALEGVGTAAAESSQTAVKGASGAAAALDGVTSAAGEERAALLATGEAAQQSGAEAKTALDQVTAAEESAAAGARELGTETKRVGEASGAFQNLVGQIEEMASALRASGADIGLQRQGILQAITATEDLVRGQLKMGEGGQANAQLATKALEGLRSKLADVDAQIKRDADTLAGLGDKGKTAFADIATSTRTFEGAASAAIGEVNAAWGSLNDNFLITPRQLQRVAQTVEATGLAIVEAGEKGIAVTLEEIALYERLQNELKSLTIEANKLTNAGRDNAVRLKETGAQITGLTSGIAQLGSALGPTGAKVGFIIGNFGQLGSVMENLKDSIAGFDLNLVSAASGAAKLGIQGGLLAAVFAAAATAGVTLANVNDQNAESTNNLWQEIKRLASGEVDKAKGQIAGLQTALQTLFIASSGAEGFGESVDGVGQGLIELAIASGRGADGVKLYNIALRDGLTPAQAMKLAAAEGAEALKFYEQATRGGAEGHELWTRGLRESEGDRDKLLAFIKAHNAEMARAVSLTGLVANARKTETESAVALRVALDQLDRAFPDAEGNTAAMISLADAIDEAAEKVRGLSADERERLKLITDLLRTGADLTDAQKQQIATLLGLARAGKDASGALNTLFRLQLSLEQATNGSTETLRDSFTVLRTLAGAWDLNSQAIRKAIGESQAALDGADRLSAAQRRQHQTVIDGFRAMDAARTQSAALESARVATMVTAEDELTRRGADATRAIQQRLTDLAQLIPMSATYGGVLKDLGGQLQSVVDGTVTLSAEDRGRLEVIIQLVAKGGELTASQQAFAASLVAAALAADKATIAGNALAKVQADIDKAVGGTTPKLQAELDVLALLSTSWDTNSVALGKAAGELANTLATTDGLTEAQRKLYEQVLNGIKQIDALTKSKEDLIAEQQKLLDVGMQMTQEQLKTYQSNQKEIYSIQGKIEATKAHSEAQIQNLQTTKEVITSTSQLVKTGAHEWTNIGTAQQSAATSATAAGAAAVGAATQVGQAGKDIGGAAGDVNALGTAASITAGNLASVGPAATNAASELSASSEKWLEQGRLLEDVATKVKTLERLFGMTADQMDRITAAAERMGPALEKAGDSATKASGYAGSKVQEVG